MRQIGALFTDVGVILRKAWLRLIAVSLIIWVVWSALMAALTAAVVDLSALNRAINSALRAAQTYGDAPIPSAVQDRIIDEFAEVPRLHSVWAWVAVGVVVVVIMFIASAYQIAACNRLGMDAAAEQPVSMGAALRSGWTGGWRLVWYFILLGVFSTVVLAVLIGLTWAAALVSVLFAVAVGVLCFFGYTALMVFLTGRLVPITVQAVGNRHALRWSWDATRGRFWAVLGRYLLWSLVASVVINLVTSVVLTPLSMLAAIPLGTSSGSGLWFTGLLTLLSVVVTMVAVAFTVIGVVPIWRDLTEDPTYRSIPASAEPEPDESA